MIGFWIVLLLAFSIVVGNAMVLLRTARKPERPGNDTPGGEKRDHPG